MRGNEGYLDELLRSLGPPSPKYIVKSTIDELRVSPHWQVHRSSKASQERGKEDGGKGFLAGPAYALQGGRLDECGQGVQVVGVSRWRSPRVRVCGSVLTA